MSPSHGRSSPRALPTPSGQKSGRSLGMGEDVVSGTEGTPVGRDFTRAVERSPLHVGRTAGLLGLWGLGHRACGDQAPRFHLFRGARAGGCAQGAFRVGRLCREIPGVDSGRAGGGRGLFLCGFRGVAFPPSKSRAERSRRGMSWAGTLQVWPDSSGAVPRDGWTQPRSRRPGSSVCLAS